jgi:hypothetical protein
VEPEASSSRENIPVFVAFLKQTNPVLFFQHPSHYSVYSMSSVWRCFFKFSSSVCLPDPSPILALARCVILDNILLLTMSDQPSVYTWGKIIISIISYLLQLNLYSLAVVLAPVQTKQISIHVPKRNNKNTVNKSTRISKTRTQLSKHPHNCQNTHTIVKTPTHYKTS